MLLTWKRHRRASLLHFSQATDEKLTLRISENAEQLWKKTVDDLNANTNFPESLEVLEQETVRWR